MTDLTSAELALAVARVMGRRAEIYDGSMWLLPPEVFSTASASWGAPGNRILAQEWRPDLGGAAAWEVLEWVRKRSGDHKGSGIFFRYDRNSQGRRCEISTGPDYGMGIGPTDAIALCRAVVALGKAG